MRFALPSRSSLAAPYALCVTSAARGHVPKLVHKDRLIYTAIGVRDLPRLCALAAVHPQATFHALVAHEDDVAKLSALATASALSNIHAIEMDGAITPPSSDVVVASAAVVFGATAKLGFDGVLRAVSDGGVLVLEYPSSVIAARLDPAWGLADALEHALPTGSAEEHLLAVARRQPAWLKADEFAQSAVRLLATAPDEAENLRNAQRSDAVIMRLTEQGFAYVGQIDTSRNDPLLSVEQSQAPMLRRLGENIGLKELLTDVLRADLWRQDVFVRGVAHEPIAAAQWLDDTLRLVVRDVRGTWTPTYRPLGGAPISLNGASFQAVAKGTARGESTLGELIADAPVIRPAILRRAAMRMLGTGQFWTVREPIPPRETIDPAKFRFQLAGEFNVARFEQAEEDKTGCEFVSSIAGDVAILVSYAEIVAIRHVREGMALGEACDRARQTLSDEASAHRVKTGRDNRNIEQVERNIEQLRSMKIINMLALGVIQRVS